MGQVRSCPQASLSGNLVFFRKGTGRGDAEHSDALANCPRSPLRKPGLDASFTWGRCPLRLA